MTAVSVTYILIAPEGFQLHQLVGYFIGLDAALLLFIIYVVAWIKSGKEHK